MSKTKKTVRPIDIDAHFKYRCPKCGSDHWVSIGEARTKDFKVVCDCKKVFSPKRISKIKILYAKPIQKIEKQPQTTQTNIQPQNTDKTINPVLLDKCLPILIGFGFTKKESEDMLKQAYEIDQCEDWNQLVKSALKSLGVNNQND